MSMENETRSVYQLSRKESEAYLHHEARWAPAVAGGVTMCILSPVLLILLTGFSSMGLLPISGTLAGGIGITVLLIIIACAVAIFIRYSMGGHGYTFIAEDRFELANGVEAMIREQKAGILKGCTKKITAGVAICILAVIPLLCSAFMENGLLAILSVVFLLCSVAAGVNLLVQCGIIWDSYTRLLRDGDYSGRVHGSLTDKIGSVYWPLVAAGYLLWSFTSRSWGITWIVWPVAGLVFAAIAGICRIQRRR